MFSEEKDRYTLEISQLQSTTDLNKGLWLILAGINEIPPHIALIQNGKYYSVSARKVKLGEPVERFLKAISRNSLPTLFIGIKRCADIPPMGGLRGAEEFFNSYSVLGNGDHSCLSPISDFFAKNYAAEFANASVVFELLAVAQKQDLLLECKSLFVGLNDKETIVLPKYMHKQIREKINSILLLKYQ